MSQPGSYYDSAFSPDGSRLAVVNYASSTDAGTDVKMTVIDTNTGVVTVSRPDTPTDGIDWGFSPDSTKLVEHWIGDQTHSRVVLIDDTTDVTLLDSQENSSSVAVAFSACGNVFGVIVDAPSASSMTVVDVYDAHGGGRRSSTTVGGYGATVSLRTTRSDHQALVGSAGTTTLVALLPNSDGQACPSATTSAAMRRHSRG